MWDALRHAYPGVPHSFVVILGLHLEWGLKREEFKACSEYALDSGGYRLVDLGHNDRAHGKLAEDLEASKGGEYC